MYTHTYIYLCMCTVWSGSELEIENSRIMKSTYGTGVKNSRPGDLVRGAVVTQVRFRSRLWDIECGACLRVLEGHEELVRCIRFDNKRIVSGAYDGCVSHAFKRTAVTASGGTRRCCMSSSRECQAPCQALPTRWRGPGVAMPHRPER